MSQSYRNYDFKKQYKILKESHFTPMGSTKLKLWTNITFTIPSLGTPKITFLFPTAAEFSDFLIDTLHEILNKRISQLILGPSLISMHLFFHFLFIWAYMFQLAEVPDFGTSRLSPIVHFYISVIVHDDSVIKIQ